MALNTGLNPFAVNLNQKINTSNFKFTPTKIPEKTPNPWDFINSAIPSNLISKAYAESNNSPSPFTKNNNSTNWNVNQNNGGGAAAVPSAFAGDDNRYSAYIDSLRSVEDTMRNEIDAAWSGYINSLNDTANTFLPQQKKAQEDIVTSQYNQGVDQANQQKTSSLRDIAGNIKNAFQAGNLYLGSRGAGDSSAAGQYQFALTQEANKQTAQLNDFVNGQLNNLKGQYDQGMSQVSNWYATAMQGVRQAIAQGELSKQQDVQNLTRDLLNTALSYKANLDQTAQSRYNSLIEWAGNNSTNISQLKSNIAAIPNVIDQIQVSSQGQAYVPTGYGSNKVEDRSKKSIFNNPSWFGM